MSAWGTIPVRCRISRRLLSILLPKILRTPEVLRDCPRSMRKVVVLPAPLGPSRPKQQPRWMSQGRGPETASSSPYALCRALHMMIGSVCIWVAAVESTRSGNAFNCSSILEVGSVPLGQLRYGVQYPITALRGGVCPITRANLKGLQARTNRASDVCLRAVTNHDRV